jgi:hypothetical protein
MFRSQIESALDREILSALEELEKTPDKTSEEYGNLIDRVSQLQGLKTRRGLKPPSWDSLLMVGANIFGILWLTNYEREQPIRSKALGFVIKPRTPQT